MHLFEISFLLSKFRNGYFGVCSTYKGVKISFLYLSIRNLTSQFPDKSTRHREALKRGPFYGLLLS